MKFSRRHFGLFLVGSIGTVFVVTQGLAEPAQKRPNRVIIYPAPGETVDELTQRGLKKVRDFGSYWLAEASDEQLNTLKASHEGRAVKANYLNRIELAAAQIDTTVGEPAIPAQLQEKVAFGNRLRLVQFVGPVLPEWLDLIKSAGHVKIVTYVPHNAYLVRLDQAAEDNLRQEMDPAGPIQWIGAYHPYYKIKPALRKPAASTVDVRVGVVDGPDAEGTIRGIQRYALSLFGQAYTVLNQRVMGLKVRAEDVAEIAQLADVVWIEPLVPKAPRDEKQDLILASRTNQVPGHGPVSGVDSYLDFLVNSVGFSTDAAQYPFVDVADTGLDVGSLDPAHISFYEFGGNGSVNRSTFAGVSRVAYLLDFIPPPPDESCVPCDPRPECACGSLGPYDCFGHGTLVSSVVAGYDDQPDTAVPCISRITETLLFTTNILCSGVVNSGILTTNICFPTSPSPTCTNFNLISCVAEPPAVSTNVIVELINVRLSTNVFTVDRRDQGDFQHGLGVSPFGRFGLSKIFSDQGQFFTECSGFTVFDLVLNEYLNRARISNNSWGEILVTGSGGNAGKYGADSQAYDLLVRDALITGATNTPGPFALNQEMIIVFAGGNDNGTVPTSFGDVLVTPPATAKNVISVGASENVRPLDGCNRFSSDSDNSLDLSHFSSFGPTEDGRFKPEILSPGSSIIGAVSEFITSQRRCADPANPFSPGADDTILSTLYGCNSGTSFSAPAVAGAGQLFWWYYINRLGNTNQPSPAMTKAYMCNSARYITGLGANDDLPSNAQGMGELDLQRMFDGVPRVIRDQQPFFSFLDVRPGATNYTPQLFSRPGQTYEVSGTVADATKPFRVTVGWTDAPGNPAAFQQLVNNLDLEVTIAGRMYRGNVFVGPNSVVGGSPDNINNMESVFLPAGQTGRWDVVVRASGLAGDGVPNKGSATDQDFALVVYNSSVASDMPNLATNDACETAEFILNFPYTSTRNLSSNVFRNTHISPSVARGGIDAFWKIPRPTRGILFSANTFGSSFDTVLSVWRVEAGAGFGIARGECGALVELVSNNNASNTFQSSVSWVSDGASSYYLIAEGQRGATGTLTLNVNASAVPITFAPTSLNFGSQLVGSTSAVQTVTLQNGTSELLLVNNVAITGANPGDFVAVSDNCNGTILAPGGTCIMHVAATPTGVGDRSAVLQVFDSATGSPRALPLSVSGLAASAVVCKSTGSVNFGQLALGFTSTVQSVTFTNCGTAVLNFTSTSLTGAGAADFTVVTNTCAGAVSPGDGCAVDLQFAPTATGSRSATLSLSSNATNSPTAIALTGTGVLPAPQVCRSRTSIAFGGVLVGSTSTVQSVTITNCGSAVLAISGVSLTGANASQFTIIGNTCAGNIPIGGTCEINVAFAPTTIGNASATISIANNASGSPHSVALTGTGTGSQPDAAVNKVRKAGTFVGRGVITPPDSITRQSVSQLARRSEKRVFFVRIKNSGNAVDSFKVTEADSEGAITVRYFLGADSALEITDQVKAGTFTTASLAAGAETSNATLVRVEVKVASNAPSASVNSVLIRATSEADPTKQDTVRARVRVR
jgi:hypothetical protein